MKAVHWMNFHWEKLLLSNLFIGLLDEPSSRLLGFAKILPMPNPDHRLDDILCIYFFKRI